MQMVRDPSDSRQRILTSTKLNVGEEPPGIIYRLEPAIVDSDAGPIRSMRLARCGTTAATSDQLLKPERKTKHARAVELLYEVLPNGQPVELDEIKRRAEEEGLAWRVVQKARTHIGCITTAAEGGAAKWTLQS
jgi:hypothetical protein